MYASIVNSDKFASGCQGYLSMLLRCSSEGYRKESSSEELLSFVAGETLSIFHRLEGMGKLQQARPEDMETLLGGLGAEAVGAGLAVEDKPVYGFSKENLWTLNDWYSDKLGNWAVEVYEGADGKLYVAGYESKETLRIKVSLSRGEGKFGCMRSFCGEVVSPEALLVKICKLVADEGWPAAWVIAYEEAPL